MRLFGLILALSALGCQKLDRFDTTDGQAYCGSVVGAQFILTPPSEGGFQRTLLMRAEIDTNLLNTTPAWITTDDAKDGPCEPQPTFDEAPVRVTPEILEDSMSLMTFEDGRDHNLIGWAQSTCRGPMLTIVTLLETDEVEVRLLKPAPIPTVDGERDAFALFALKRAADCGF